TSWTPRRSPTSGCPPSSPASALEARDCPVEPGDRQQPTQLRRSLLHDQHQPATPGSDRAPGQHVEDGGRGGGPRPAQPGASVHPSVLGPQRDAQLEGRSGSRSHGGQTVPAGPTGRSEKDRYTPTSRPPALRRTGIGQPNPPGDPTMRKIVSNFFISLDGVVEAPHEWHFPYFDDAMGQIIGDGMASQTTFLMGRNLYDEWSRYW